jgi:hypothetical protein
MSTKIQQNRLIKKAENLLKKCTTLKFSKVK